MSVQQTLTGGAVEGRRERPETLLQCPECERLILRSRRHEHPHNLDDADSVIEAQRKQLEEKIPDEAKTETQTFEVTFHYELVERVTVEAATELGYNGFPFLIAVTFAAANAFLTPIGYQTNLMVYGPGGYRFTDYARVGAPLQLILAVVTTLSIAALWPP